MGQQTKDHQHQANDQYPFDLVGKINAQIGGNQIQFHGHHHHHSHNHHKKSKYQRPHHLNTPIGLYALKKLNIMNPNILTEKEKRLLEPVAPGIISSIAITLPLLINSFIAFNIWRKNGIRGIFTQKSLFTLGGLSVLTLITTHTVNYLRELQWYSARQKLVEKYKNTYSEKFLIDTLSPSFRLPENLQSL